MTLNSEAARRLGNVRSHLKFQPTQLIQIDYQMMRSSKIDEFQKNGCKHMRLDINKTNRQYKQQNKQTALQ